MSSDSQLRLGKPICIAATGDQCGEGILWEAARQQIYWTDINRFLVHRYNLESSAVKTWMFSEPVTCVLPTNREDTMALVLGSSVALWEPERDRRIEPVFSLPGWPFVRCNDAAVDPQGNLWMGSMRNNVKEDGEPGEAGGWDGILYRIGGDGKSTEWRSGLGVSNTLLWSPDNSRFYFGDTFKNTIWSYEYSLTDGSIRGEQPMFQGYERGWPDGSTIDADGYIWNCRYGGSCIVRVAPDGQIDREIEMPVSNVTNCTFGGKGGNTLYITTASPDGGKWERFGGCLFAIETNISGAPSHAFRCF
jgi:sugar lactone lactonase YvrE